MKTIARHNFEFPGSARGMLLRFSMYTFAILLLAGCLPLAAKYGTPATFKENGPVELAQICLLVLSGAIFTYEGKRLAYYREAFYLAASFAAFAAIRELDVLFDQLIPVLGWKVGYALILFFGVSSYSNREKLKQQAMRCIQSRAFSLLWAGFIVAIPFAQLVGNSAFLSMVMGGDYDRDYNRTIEELGELMGYGLILLGTIELSIQKGALYRPGEYAKSEGAKSEPKVIA